jgi:tRNA A-37 threonylcarbamoyl transferase component Bud32
MVGPKPEDLAPGGDPPPTQPYSTPFTDAAGPPHQSPLTLPEGTVFGPYRIEKKLGQGGMGVVYRATDTTLDRVVAFKVMRPELLSKTNFKERFLREAKAAAQVMHANVVVIHQAGELHGTLFMAFEFVPGGDLSTRLESGPLAPADAVRLLIECASGLDAIHQAGMVHRDIKPQNIFLDKLGRSKLGDLGLARSVEGDDRMTVTGVAIGTPAFMSPEQIEGDPDLDIRSDIHALGATLFNVLTGYPPFTGNTMFSITNKIMAPERPSLRQSHPQIPERLQRIVNKAMARDRADRHQTPQELIDDLRGRALPAVATAPTAVPAAAAATMATSVDAGRAPAQHAGRDWGVRIAVVAILALVVCAAWYGLRTSPHGATIAQQGAPAATPAATAVGPAAAVALAPPATAASPSHPALTPPAAGIQTAPILSVIMEPPNEPVERPAGVNPHSLTVAQELGLLERHFGVNEEDARRLLKLLNDYHERRQQILRDSNDDFSQGTVAQIRRQRERTEMAAAAFLTPHQQDLLQIWLTLPHGHIRPDAPGP